MFPGPADLNLYSVVELRSCLQDDIDEAAHAIYQGLLIEFFLRKPLTGNFLTQILPTTLFVIIRFIIRIHFLDAEVSLTLALSVPSKVLVYKS